MKTDETEKYYTVKTIDGIVENCILGFIREQQKQRTFKNR